MYPTFSSRSRKMQLVDDYVEGVQQLYGSNSMFNGTTMRSSMPRTTSRERDASGGEVRWRWRWGSVMLPAIVMFGL